MARSGSQSSRYQAILSNHSDGRKNTSNFLAPAIAEYLDETLCIGDFGK